VYVKWISTNRLILTYYKYFKTVNNKIVLTRACRRHVQRLSTCALSFWQRWPKTCAQTRFDQFVVKFSPLYRTRAKGKHTICLLHYTQNKIVSLWAYLRRFELSSMAALLSFIFKFVAIILSVFNTWSRSCNQLITWWTQLLKYWINQFRL